MQETQKYNFFIAEKTNKVFAQSRKYFIFAMHLANASLECLDGGTGRRAGLKIQWRQLRGGSIPPRGTQKKVLILSGLFYFYITQFLLPIIFKGTKLSFLIHYLDKIS